VVFAALGVTASGSYGGLLQSVMAVAASLAAMLAFRTIVVPGFARLFVKRVNMPCAHSWNATSMRPGIG
jgi:hypothetical protein